jgi:hypothetical protein
MGWHGLSEEDYQAKLKQYKENQEKAAAQSSEKK